MSETARRTGGRAPISAHPAFPAIVALWFAAMLGLGSFALPAGQLEAMVAASGLPSFVAAAQPPLGMTARLLIALAAAGFGGVLGMVIARRVSAASRTAPRAPRTRPAIKPPLSIHDELSEDGIDEDSVFLRRSPMPDYGDGDADIADFSPVEDAAAPAPADPLDLGEFAQPIAAPVTAPDATPLADLAMVQLVERFAMALQQHRERPTPADMRAHSERADPVVAFPGQPAHHPAPRMAAGQATRPDAAETERALRDALAKLQRMSGAA